MRFYSTTFMIDEGEGVFCHLDRLGDRQSLCMKLNGSVSNPYHDEQGVVHFNNDSQWINFKNSVLAADEKMFGRR